MFLAQRARQSWVISLSALVMRICIVLRPDSANRYNYLLGACGQPAIRLEDSVNIRVYSYRLAAA